MILSLLTKSGSIFVNHGTCWRQLEKIEILLVYSRSPTFELDNGFQYVDLITKVLNCFSYI